MVVKTKIKTVSTEETLESQTPVEKKSLVFKRPTLYFTIALILLLCLVSALVWQNKKLRQKQAVIVSAVKSSEAIKIVEEKQVANNDKLVLENVSKLVILPPDEQPTIATVADLDKLKDQPFFAKAEVGDKVLVYTKGKKAILYRLSTNQIIELAPLNIGDSQVSSMQNSTQKLSVEIRNGSGVSGAAGIWKQKITSKNNFLVTKTGNATNGNYTSNLIVDFTHGGKSSLLSSLREVTGGQVSAVLPTGEAKSSSDVLLIVGK